VPEFTAPLKDGALHQLRILPFEKGRNFRDLGGYATSDGRVLRWGRVFRSGVMTYFTENDRKRFAELGVRTVCDLRSQHERILEPTILDGTGISQLAWNYDAKEVSLSKYFKRSDFSAEVARSGMIDLYRSLPYRFSKQYAQIFRSLAAGSVPIVINCSAGKDRTGVAAALVLSAFGVAREEVLEDFTLTDTAVDLERALFEHTTSSMALGDDYEFLKEIGHAARAPVIRADRDYLLSAFEQIEQSDGSIEAYLRTKLGVTDEMLMQAKLHLVAESPPPQF